MIQAQFHEKTYSDEHIVELCQVSGLQPENVTKFREELEEIAAVYRWEASKYANLPRSSDVGKDLKALIKRINRLEDGLENLSDEAAYFLSMAVDRNNSTDSQLSITDALSDDAPSLTISLIEPDSPIAGLELGVPEVMKFLSGLERAAKDAVGSLPKRGRGQLRDHGLRLWMRNIEMLWERSTSAAFTRDETASGEPITPAARFCVAAFHCISPDYPATRILLEMKDSIRQSRKSAGRIVAQKDQ